MHMESSDQLGFLVYSDGEGAHRFALKSDAVSIGRQSDQDLHLKDSFVSRQHAVIRRVDSGYEVVDQRSSQGTYVNGARVERAVLHAGDVVQFGSSNATKHRFQLGAADEEDAHTSLAEDLLGALSRISGSGRREPAPAREMGQLNFLLNAARKLNAGAARTDILQALLQLSIQLTGVERGFVFLRQDGAMRLALGLRADGSPLAEDSTISRRAMQSAIESASKFSVSDTLSDAEATPWESVMANSIRSIYCIPLRKHASSRTTEELLGLLYLDSQVDAARLTSIDSELLDTIATEAATLLENALLAEKDMEARRAAEELAIAARIHAGLMSVALPRAPFAALQAKAVPCREIGGDFYDAVLLPDALAVVIADVSGKGVPASIVAATLQGIIHAQMLANQSLTEIAALVNRFLCTRSVGKYATAVLMKVFADGEVEWVNCGHVKPLLISNGEVTQLSESNLMVGLIEEATYSAGKARMTPGDRIVLATDGIVEAENAADEQFGDEQFLESARAQDLGEILERVREFQQQQPLQDDCTLFEVRYLGSPGN
jgi:serine phosphatase RsbU (regulator of sigma subunit)